MNPSDDIDYKILSDKIASSLDNLPRGIKKSDAVKILASNIYPVMIKSNRDKVELASIKILNYIDTVIVDDANCGWPFTMKNLRKIISYISNVKDAL